MSFEDAANDEFESMSSLCLEAHADPLSPKSQFGESEVSPQLWPLYVPPSLQGTHESGIPACAMANQLAKRKSQFTSIVSRPTPAAAEQGFQRHLYHQSSSQTYMGKRGYWTKEQNKSKMTQTAALRSLRCHFAVTTQLLRGHK